MSLRNRFYIKDNKDQKRGGASLALKENGTLLNKTDTTTDNSLVINSHQYYQNQQQYLKQDSFLNKNKPPHPRHHNTNSYIIQSVANSQRYQNTNNNNNNISMAISNNNGITVMSSSNKSTRRQTPDHALFQKKGNNNNNINNINHLNNDNSLNYSNNNNNSIHVNANNLSVDQVNILNDSSFNMLQQSQQQQQQHQQKQGNYVVVNNNNSSSSKIDNSSFSNNNIHNNDNYPNFLMDYSSSDADNFLLPKSSSAKKNKKGVSQQQQQQMQNYNNNNGNNQVVSNNTATSINKANNLQALLRMQKQMKLNFIKNAYDSRLNKGLNKSFRITGSSNLSMSEKNSRNENSRLMELPSQLLVSSNNNLQIQQQSQSQQQQMQQQLSSGSNKNFCLVGGNSSSATNNYVAGPSTSKSVHQQQQQGGLQQPSTKTVLNSQPEQLQYYYYQYQQQQQQQQQQQLRQNNNQNQQQQQLQFSHSQNRHQQPQGSQQQQNSSSTYHNNNSNNNKNNSNLQLHIPQNPHHQFHNPRHQQQRRQQSTGFSCKNVNKSFQQGDEQQYYGGQGLLLRSGAPRGGGKQNYYNNITHNCIINNSNNNNNNSSSIISNYASCTNNQRMESALSLMNDEGSLVRQNSGSSGYNKFFEGSVPIDLAQILPNNNNMSKYNGSCNSNSNNNNYESAKNMQIMNTSLSSKSPAKIINQTNSYNVMRNTQLSMLVQELVKQAKKCFKESNLTRAVELFKEALSHDPQCLESKFLLGVCYLGQCSYQMAVQQFQEVREENPGYKRNIYLLESIAYKKMNEIESSISILNHAVQRFPKYSDAYIYRGKLLLKQKLYEKALQDFQNATNLNPSSGLAFLGKADCHKFLKQYQKSIETYTKAIEADPSLKCTATLKRAIVYLEQNSLDKAQADLLEVEQIDSCNSEALYFKGIVAYRSKNFQDAILSFEQAIKHNNSKKAVTKSLFEIAKLHIENRDFYAAYHTLSRGEYLQVDRQQLEKYRLFTEFVLFLMKRKYQEAIDTCAQIFSGSPSITKKTKIPGNPQPLFSNNSGLQQKDMKKKKANNSLTNNLIPKENENACLLNNYSPPQNQNKKSQMENHNSGSNNKQSAQSSNTNKVKRPVIRESNINNCNEDNTLNANTTSSNIQQSENNNNKRNGKKAFQNSSTCFGAVVDGFLLPMIYKYRAYGLFCLGKHRQALEDYAMLEESEASDKGIVFNKSLCEGILCVQNVSDTNNGSSNNEGDNNNSKNENNHNSSNINNNKGNAALAVVSSGGNNNNHMSKKNSSSASQQQQPSSTTKAAVALTNSFIFEDGNTAIQNGLNYFSVAAHLFPQRAEPLFYSAVALIKMALRAEDADLRCQTVLDALRELDRAIQLNDTNANLYYFRAIMHCSLGYFNEGVQDVDKAIEKSEDNVPKYFFLRGHIFGCCKSHKQAVNDLSICISLDDNFREAYMERAKNYAILLEYERAVQDANRAAALASTNNNNTINNKTQNNSKKEKEATAAITNKGQNNIESNEKNAGKNQAVQKQQQQQKATSAVGDQSQLKEKFKKKSLGDAEPLQRSVEGQDDEEEYYEKEQDFEQQEVASQQQRSIANELDKTKQEDEIEIDRLDSQDDQLQGEKQNVQNNSNNKFIKVMESDQTQTTQNQQKNQQNSSIMNKQAANSDSPTSQKQIQQQKALNLSKDGYFNYWRGNILFCSKAYEEAAMVYTDCLVDPNSILKCSLQKQQQQKAQKKNDSKNNTNFQPKSLTTVAVAVEDKNKDQKGQNNNYNGKEEQHKNNNKEEEADCEEGDANSSNNQQKQWYNNLIKRELIKYQRGKCNLVLLNLEATLSDFAHVVEATKNEDIEFDTILVSALNTASIVVKQTLQKHQTVVGEGEDILADSTQIQQQQIKQQLYSNALHLVENLLTQRDVEEGKIFLKHDVYFYYGVLMFYNDKFDEAIDYFSQSLIFKEQRKEEEIRQKREKKLQERELSSSFLMPSSSSDRKNRENANNNQQDDTDEDQELLQMLEQEQQVYKYDELLYDIGVCYLMLKQYQQAKDTLEKIGTALSDVQKDYYNVLMRIIQHEIEFLNLKAKDQACKSEFKSEKSNFQILQVYPSDQKLCGKFATVKVPFSTIENLEIRLSFNLPKVPTPNLQPFFNTRLLEQFEITDVDNKPEAPWIKRTQDGIIFTDNVQVFDNLDLETEDRKEKQDQKQLDEDNDLDFDNIDDHFENKSHDILDQLDDGKKQVNIVQLKQNLALDKDIEDKLNKMMKKQQKK